MPFVRSTLGPHDAVARAASKTSQSEARIIGVF
jgi:hypothetical protein